MTKMFFLSLLLIPAAVHCMEDGKKHLDNIALERNHLEETLYSARNWVGLPFESPLQYLVICKYPKREYGYVETDNNFYKGALCDLSVETLSKMNKLKNACYKGYSAMGIATLATGISDQEKKKIIQNLFSAGFMPTEKDTNLVYALQFLVS